MFTACSNDVEETTTHAPRMVDVAIVAEAEEDTRLDVVGNTTHWEVGDSISLYLIVNYYTTATATLTIASASDISNDGKRAIFRGSVPEGYYYGITVLYPAMDSSSTTPTLDREAANNIFMVSCKQYDNGVQITDNSEIPITFSHLMHKVDYHLSLADGYTSDDLNAESIAIEMSATSQGSPIAFMSKATYNVRSNTLSTVATTKQVMAYGKGSELHTMLFPLNTTRGVAFTFGIYINGEKRYEISKPNSGTINTFKMSAGKSTSVNLVLSRENSVGGGDVIEQKALTLSASKSSIDANGVDSSRLSVSEEGGGDVTSQCTLYLGDGTKLYSPTFTTTTPGTYTLYAERNGIRSNNLTIIAKEVTTSGKSIVFAEGVTLTSGWYDVNKKGTGENGDINMCWAAASSNMIEWFQDRYVAAGNQLPTTALSGPGTKSYDSYGPYELALMEIYHADWDNSRGGNVEYAIPWYFEGTLYDGQYMSNTATPKSSGGYWKSVWSSVEPYIYRGYKSDLFPDQFPKMYTHCYNNYYLWGQGSSLQGKERMKYVSNLIVECFERGMASLTVSLSSTLSSNHHAVTLWGYEIDNATGLFTRVWITDSDDMEREPKTPLLNEYTVSIGDGNSHPKFTGDTRYGALYLVSIHPFSGYQK